MMRNRLVYYPNDGLAGDYRRYCSTELWIKNHVIIVGMDANLWRLKRLVAGTQDATAVYMDLKNMASAAVVDQAVALAKGEKSNCYSRNN